jgi:hypothetical protein
MSAPASWEKALQGLKSSQMGAGNGLALKESA